MYTRGAVQPDDLILAKIQRVKTQGEEMDDRQTVIFDSSKHGCVSLILIHGKYIPLVRKQHYKPYPKDQSTVQRQPWPYYPRHRYIPLPTICAVYEKNFFSIIATVSLLVSAPLSTPNLYHRQRSLHSSHAVSRELRPNNSRVEATIVLP